MILKIDTSLFERIGNITINQLVFLSLVLDNNQKTIKDVAAVISQVSDNEIQDLIDRDLITKETKAKKLYYKETESLVNIITPEHTFFDEFLEHYPMVVVRPDGTKGYLHSNSKKCRILYNKIIKRDCLLHQHIVKCLDTEVQDKTNTGKIGYMKTMWKWLTNSEWENYEGQMNTNPIEERRYGTDLL